MRACLEFIEFPISAFPGVFSHTEAAGVQQASRESRRAAGESSVPLGVEVVSGQVCLSGRRRGIP